MIYEDMNINAVRIKALFGLDPLALGNLLKAALPDLERRRAERLANRSNRKRPPIPNDGRPRVVKPYQKVLMTLIYLRYNMRHEVVGRCLAIVRTRRRMLSMRWGRC